MTHAGAVTAIDSIAEIKKLADQGADTEALAVARTAHRAKPNDVHVHIQLVRELEACGRAEEALQEADRLVGRHKNNAQVHCVRAGIYARMQRFDEALEDTAAALSFNRQDYRAYCLRAEFLLASGQPDEALSAARHAVTLSPESNAPYLTLAGVCFAQGDYNGMREAIASVREHTPVSATADFYEAAIAVAGNHYGRAVEVLYQGDMTYAKARALRALTLADHSPVDRFNAALATLAPSSGAATDEYAKLVINPATMDDERKNAESIESVVGEEIDLLMGGFNTQCSTGCRIFQLRLRVPPVRAVPTGNVRGG